MASYHAIQATCEAIVRVLQQSWQPARFDDAPLQFKVFGTRSFDERLEVGVSLFLIRVAVNGGQRPPPAEAGRRPALLLDLHFLLTPWAKEPSLEQEILGWAMRTIEDHAILSAGVLNSVTPGVFTPGETIEIVPGQLSTEEMVRIWDVLPGEFQLSVPYVARILRIESEVDLREAGPVLTRQLDYGVIAGEER